MNSIKLLILSSFLISFCFVKADSQNVKSIYNFNEDWSFLLDDSTLYSTEDYSHSAWCTVDVPHDWSIEGEYDKTNPMGGSAGYLPGGIAYYRKKIEVPTSWKGNSVHIAFDGVFMNSTVYANGKELGTRPYGWVSFAYDISDIVATTDSIVFAVRVDNELQPSARWYTGSGIYADTWIEVRHPLHIVRNEGVFVRTEDNSTVMVTSKLENTTSTSEDVEFKSRILDAEGIEVAIDQVSGSLTANQTLVFNQTFNLTDANLWSVESPYLYTMVSEVWYQGSLIDSESTRFGVRTVEWVHNDGLLINGEVVKLRGVCNHQDAGPLGAAVPDKILQYRIQQLKDMGCNAIRTSHNPQTPKFYDLCDEIGMLVMDEIFDGWKQKAKNDYGAHSFNDWWERDLTDWIYRDRNHASVIVYSLGNETSGSIASSLVSACHSLDPTRLVTSGHSNSSQMDIIGVNGAGERVGYFDDYDDEGKVLVGTENTHTWQVRGYYRSKTWYRDGLDDSKFATEDLTETEVFKHDWVTHEARGNAKKVFNSSYDNAYVRLNCRGSIEQIRDTENLAGCFRWTGHDYIGEASYVHGGWPFKGFMGGVIDLANFEKDHFYLYQSQWTDSIMLHILPHWTHPVMEDTVEIPVWVYSNCDEVELFFNGVSLGKDIPGTTRFDMQCDWLVRWQPGTLRAVGYKDGVAVIGKSVTSAYQPTQNQLSIDGAPLANSGKDIVQVRVSAQDSLGTFYPYGENRTYFSVLGPGRIRALGNGSPIDVESHYGVNNRMAFYGLTRAFIESNGLPGDINLLAAAIMGEKKQVTSNRVSIDAKILNLRGDLVMPDIKVYYTVDGSTPTEASTLYQGSFSVTLGTTVKAIIMVDGSLELELEERFAEDEGFVWNDPLPGSEAADPNSDQAEDAIFHNATIATGGSGWNGTGFLDFGSQSKGYVEWYQENDGDVSQRMLNIRYSCNVGNGDGRTINVIVNDEEIATELLLPNTGSWGKDWAEVSIEVTIQQGANTIRLQNPASGGAYLDQISLNAVADEAPLPGEVAIDSDSNQAEDAVYSGASEIIAGTGYNGSGFLDFGQNKQGYVHWVIHNPDAAKKDIINLRYSCNGGGAIGGKLVNVVLNSDTVEKSLLLPNTGSWGNHWNDKALEVDLISGENTLRIVNVASGGAYIDEINYNISSQTEGCLSNDITITPNPTVDMMTIVGADNPLWTIYTMTGQKILHGQGNVITTKALNQGEYLIYIQNTALKFLRE